MDSGTVSSAARALAEWCSVVKIYSGTATRALDEVSFEVHRNEIVVLVGPNGSGKTTAMEMVSGLRAPTRGQVRVLGKSVSRGRAQALHLGVQLQDAGLPLRLRVKEAVRAVTCLYQDPGPVEQILKALGLDRYTNTMVDSLSSGWQRRLDVALACVGRPEVLVLDEPTSGIDPTARAELWEYLRQQRADGVGMLVSTHDLAEAESYADRLLVLHQGRLALSGSVPDVLAHMGGDWRLRLVRVASDLTALARQTGMTFISSGDSQVALGSRDQICRLADTVEQAHAEGHLDYQDLLRGPVRLEDVFSFVISAGDNHVS